MPIPPLLLQGWLVDRASGMTAGGQVQLVVLSLRADGREFTVALSKVDAFLLSQKLAAASTEAQAAT